MPWDVKSRERGHYGGGTTISIEDDDEKKRKFINKQKAYKNITAMSNYAREIMNVWQLFRSEG